MANNNSTIIAIIGKIHTILRFSLNGGGEIGVWTGAVGGVVLSIPSVFHRKGVLSIYHKKVRSTKIVIILELIILIASS